MEALEAQAEANLAGISWTGSGSKGEEVVRIYPTLLLMEHRTTSISPSILLALQVLYTIVFNVVHAGLR